MANIENFDPSGVGLKNGNFIGLPFDEANANIVFLPVPWDVTVSYTDGTATAAENIRVASSQLDLYDPDLKDAWKSGIFMHQTNQNWLLRNVELRKKAKRYIEFLESGGDIGKNKNMQKILAEINKSCAELKDWVYEQTSQLLNDGKLVGLIGGEHSVPLGYLEALSEQYGEFGVLQIDAHLDLRMAYEGFQFSHASIFYNASKIKEISKFVHVGIRDYCEAEVDFVEISDGRHKAYYDYKIKEALCEGATFEEIAKKIIKQLPKNVYISFDIDGLDPKLCPATGTPVAGGLEYHQAVYLLKALVKSGRRIIGFDLCEVGGIENEWDGNVAARILYKMTNLMVKSQK